MRRQGRSPRWSGLRPAATTLAVLLTGVVLAYPLVCGGCGLFSRGEGLAGGAGPEGPKTLADIVAELNWSLAAAAQDPAGEGVYELTVSNPGPGSRSLAGLEAYLLAEVGSPSAVSAAVPLPGSLGPGASAEVKLSLPTEATWPEEFAITAMVRRAPGTEEPVFVARGFSRPGRIALTAVWPPEAYVDYTLGEDFLELRFDTAVGLDSLGASVALRADPPLASGEPGVPVTVQPSQNGEPLTYEVHPREPLTPFTRYRLTVSAGLASADGSVRMGRDRAFFFSTGASPGLYQPSWAPSWSPDGTRVAWTAPDPDGRLRLYVGDTATMTASAKASPGLGCTPAWSADGRCLYFATEQSQGAAVSRLDLKSGEATVVVGAQDLGSPCLLGLRISPDGTRLAIEANYGAVDAHSDVMQSIYVADLATGALARLPEHGLAAMLVGWSGDRVLYAATFENYDHSHTFRYNLYRYALPSGFGTAGATAPASGPSGSGQEEVLLSAGELQNVAGYCVAAGAATASGASGAAAVAFCTWEAQSFPRWIVHRPGDVWVLRGLDEATPPAARKLTSGGGYRQVSLSPDGTLAAVATARDGSWDVALLDTSDAMGNLVADGPAAQFAPVWDPDGNRIAYFEAQGRAFSVRILDPATETGSVFTVGP